MNIRPLLHPTGAFACASLSRRLAAISYDSLLCLALLMLVSALYWLCLLGIHGAVQLKILSTSGALDSDPLLGSLCLITLFAFFAKFWTHSGQTLGMQVWKIRVQNSDGTAIDLWQALLRFLIAIISWLSLGLGFLWIVKHPKKCSWHDLYSDSYIVCLNTPVNRLQPQANTAKRSNLTRKSRAVPRRAP